jgi:hypothetical protein
VTCDPDLLRFESPGFHWTDSTQIWRKFEVSGHLRPIT